jgi:hypothetical protein
MRITLKKLIQLNACDDAVREFAEQKETDPIKLINKMIKTNDDKYLSWSNWLIVRCMKYKQYVGYAVYAAKQVLSLYEKDYPKDKRSRAAINAAIRCIKNPTKKNKNVAQAAYATADAAACAAADAAACAAADAAAYAARAAARAANAARAAAYAAYAAARAANAAGKKMKIKILKYGIKLLQEENNDNRKDTQKDK